VPATTAPAPNMLPRVLLIDDEADMLVLLKAILSGDYAVDATTSAGEALGWLQGRDYDAVLTDLKMAELGGLEVLDAVKRRDEKLPVVVVTAFATVESAVAAMQRGAFDYLTKPFRKDAILVVVRRAVEWRRLHRQLRHMRDELSERYRHIVGQSPAIREAERLIGQVCSVNVPVLICGPRGSGKEAVARAIHHLGPRREGPYVPLLCAGPSSGRNLAQIQNELMLRLFGRGENQPGALEAATGGTLFIDEVACLPPSAQARLAEAARQSQGRPVPESFRLLVGTNSGQGALQARGQIEPGLAELLGLFHIMLPPLAERGEDIPLLAQHFVQKYAQRYRKPVEELSELALRWLISHEWPGNVAELENVVQRGVIMARAKVIEESDLIPADYVAQGLPYAARDIFSLPLPEAEERLMASFHREYLRKALARARGDVAAAAAAAGLSKADLSRLLKEYEIEGGEG